MRNAKAHFGDRVARRFRLGRLVALCLLTLPLAGYAIGEQKLLYTPGYFLDEAKWDVGTYAYYHDYEIEKAIGKAPSISPYLSRLGSGGAVLNYQGYDRLTFTVKDAGRYVSSWRFYAHGGDRLVGEVAGYSDHQHSYTATYSFLAGLSGSPSEIDIIPLLEVMQFNLAYDKNGGEWKDQPLAKDYLWSNRVSIATSAVISREGHKFQGWNRKKDGSGLSIAAGASFDSAGTGLGVSNHQEKVVLYAQWKVLQYKLKLIFSTGIDKIYYKVNGATSWTEASADTEVKVNYGTTWYAYAVPKNGYSYSATSETSPRSDKMGLSGATFEPSATAKSFSVSFNGNGKTSGSMSSKTFTVDCGDYLPANEFSRGYEVSFDARGGSACSSQTATYPFKNWNNEADGLGVYTYTDQQMVINPCGSTGEAKMLYAQWDTGRVEPITLPTTTKAGHSFAGWYADSNLETFVGLAGATHTPTKNETLYAKWTELTYTVTFRDGYRDADDAVIAVKQVGYGGRAEPPEPPSHQYSEFTGWDSKAYENVTGDVTIRANYQGKVYQIAYQSNYRNGTVEKTFLSQTCGPDLDRIMVTLIPAKSIPISKVGYTFAGWDWNWQTSEPEWFAGEEMSYGVIDEHPDGKLYAIWSPNSYSVRFDGNGATGGEMAEQNFIYDQVDELCANSFTRDGQTFLGWTDDQGRQYVDGQVVSNLTVEANGCVTLKARWSNYHYVAFDGMGATNATPMAAQQFSGAETNALSANLYGKVGYAFAGWATNAVSATNLVVTYTNCQSASFPLAKPNETNWLYAVWTTNRYTIAFDPGTDLKSPYFFGTMEPHTNCVYDTPITIKCGYTNYCSQGLLGWSRTPGGTTPEYPVSGKSPVTQGSVAIVSNLTASANGRVVLYAVWAGVGELSEAVGLTNAALSFEWTSGDDDVRWHVVKNFTEAPDHSPCIALESGEGKKQGYWHLRSRVFGSGTLRFTWYWEPYGALGSDAAAFKVKVDNVDRCDLDRDTYWPDKMTIVVNGDGSHDIDWVVYGEINSESDVDKICLDDITWTPGAELKPGEATPVYATEAEAISAAELARVLPPNDEVAAVVSAEDYGAMFKVSAVPASQAGKWTLAAELKDEVKEEVRAALDGATKELASAATNNPVSVSFVLKPGLYYGLAGVSDLASWSTASPTNWVLGQGGAGQELSMDKPEGTSAFYSIRVSLTPPITP